MTYLTDSRVGVATRTYRYYVQLISTQLDPDGITESERIVDVVVTEPGREAITLVVAGCGWLKGFEIISFWTPEEDCPF